MGDEYVSAEELLSYGMECIGTVRIVDNRFSITVTNPHALKFERCIYAFLIGDEILRIGKSKDKLQKRISEWQRDVSNAFAGTGYRTPKSESDIWKAFLAEHGTGQLYARLGTTVTTPVGTFTTPVGTFNLYIEEESALIAKHKPRAATTWLAI